MNRRLMYVVIAIVAIALLLPLTSYSSSAGSSVTITVKAKLDEGSHQATYSISFDKGSASYLDHIVNWWQGLVNPAPKNPAEGLEIYPLVEVQVQANWGLGFDSNGNPLPPQVDYKIYPYQFGNSWQCSYKIIDVPANGQIKVTVWIFWSAEMNDGGLMKTYVG